MSGYFSDYDNYCQGYLDNPDNGHYVIVPHVATVAVRASLGTVGLNRISAFDLAEIDGRNLGQVNAIIVSSFCGLNGRIWGYDFNKKEMAVAGEVNNVKIYNGDPLLDAATELFGTLEDRKFPILPGSMVPAALKDFYDIGPSRIYALLAIGISENRDKDACILMEDAGRLEKDERFYIFESAMSVIEVANNQKIRCKEIIVCMRSMTVNSGFMGCALTMAPYIKLARLAENLM